VATASEDSTVRLWDTDTGKQHGPTLEGHTDWVTGVAFSPDGVLLASSSTDLTVRLWNVETGDPHGPPLTGHADALLGVAYSPQHDRLATASRDATARLWWPFFEDWVRVGCHLVGRNLSMAEWRKLLPDTPYERTCPDLPAGQKAPSDSAKAQYDD
jgi:hypothetical protein